MVERHYCAAVGVSKRQNETDCNRKTEQERETKRMKEKWRQREREKERECVCVCVKQNRNAYLFLLLESMRQRISFLLSLWQMLSRHPRTKQIKEEREEEKQRGAADKEEHSYLC